MEWVDRNGTAAVPEGACTVGQLNEEIERALADAGDRFPSHVVGEIAEVDDYGFGTFFELRDPEADPSISCLAWANTVASFDHDLAPGTEAVVGAEVDFYPDRGDCQLLVTE
jgi:exonuclease VII large subunit